MRSAAGAAGLALAVAIAGCARAPAPGPSLRPGLLAGSNVLLVTIDTLRRDRIGAYGSRSGLTPTIDRLAGSGVRFSRAYSHVPMTLPAHASILTGRLPPGHGIRTNGIHRLSGDVPTLATVLKGAGYRNGAFVGAFVLDARYGLGRAFDVYDDHYDDADRSTFAVAERRADDVVRAAGDWILAPASSGRWFAWVHLFDPHAPYHAPAEYQGGRAPYDAEVAYTDAMLGRLLDRLRSAGALDRTVIVVTADHGESLGDHGETTHGLFAYDATLAVPLIFSSPVIAGAVLDGAAGHADILPTICELIGVAPPAALDGVSLVSAPAADRFVYFEALDAAITRGWAPLTGVATAGWKFIDLPERELYDLSSDPAEMKNLAAGESARLTAMAQATRTAVAGSVDRPPAPAAGLTDEAARKLQSLGYVAAASGAGNPAKDASAAQRADDPKRLVALNERFNTALSAFNAGDAEAALAGFRATLAERPDFLSARTSAATVLIAAGRAPEAVALLRDGPSEQAASPELLARLGIALREAGDLAAAARTLEQARAAGAQNPELANDLGVVYARMGRAREARTLFDELLASDPGDATTWNNLAVLELSSGRPAEAAVAFRRAVDADPGRGDAWQGLGAALVDRDRPAAIAAWRTAERLRPHDYDLLFNLGSVLAESPTPAEALPYLERFVREAPRDRYGADIPTVEAVIRQVRR
jgi:arylsulfatase A-like enzyme/Flp pilus assembly protein TadD